MSMNARSSLIALAIGLTALAGSAQVQEPQKPPKIEIAITDKGFTPSEATVTPNTPVELVFTRTAERTCATEVVIPSLKVKKPLPLNEAVSIVITPEDKDITFSCGMNMLRGKLVVK
jgi:plastocyanin domain-containing protein